MQRSEEDWGDRDKERPGWSGVAGQGGREGTEVGRRDEVRMGRITRQDRREIEPQRRDQNGSRERKPGR